MEIGSYIKNLRETKDISQRQLAHLSGISNTEINRIENGERKNPSPNTLKKLAPHLGVSGEDLMEKAGYLNNNNEKNNNKARLLFGRINKLPPESQKKLERELEWLEDIERKMQEEKRK